MRNKFFLMIFIGLFIGGAVLCAGCDYEDEESFSYNDYKEIEAKQIVELLEVNPAAVAKNTVGQNLKIVGGRIDNIDADGMQFSLNCGEIFINSILCVVQEDSPAQQQLLRLAKGQAVTVYGVAEGVENVTNWGSLFSAPAYVGDIYGCVISVVKIEVYRETSTKTYAVKDPRI